ncbi:MULTISPECIES: DUF1963 domain-containing protein [unclassified Novosphingobium]|uniref:DUF1963 domain-containing protein n=1 Tax=unclassified Novosphingobium TaxID=2644732 RepID=UPI0025D0AFDD|nr:MULTISPECIES: DUF1963 domain-containing protein [unclassified Novosphingobium]
MDWFDEKLKALENERNFKLRVFRRIIDEKGNPIPRNPAKLKAEKAKFLKSKKLALIGRPSEQKKRSYSGGLPLLPSEIAWPMVDETPFVFVCQIDLSEISIDDKFEWLPDKGTIFFFVAPSTCDETAPELFRVIHSFDSTDHQHPLPVGGAPPYPRFDLTFESDFTYDLEFSASALQHDDQVEFDKWAYEVNAARKSHTKWQLDGWPCDLQSNKDMPRICEMRYRNLTDNDHGVLKSQNFSNSLADWVFIGRVHRTGLDSPWAYYHCGYFWVRKSDAKRGDFSKAMFFTQSD